MALGSSQQVLRRLAAYALPHWRLAAGTLVVTLVATAADLAIPWVLKEVVDTGLKERVIATLIVLAAVVVALTAVKGTAQFGRQFASEWLGQRVVFTMRNQLYRHVQSLSFGYHDRARTGELMARTTSDVERRAPLRVHGGVPARANRAADPGHRRGADGHRLAAGAAGAGDGAGDGVDGDVDSRGAFARCSRRCRRRGRT